MHRRPSMHRAACALLVALALALTACGDPAPPATRDGLRVVATTSIVGDVVSSIVGDAGEVEVLMAPGQDPHAFEPSARQAQSLREADLVVANGLGLEAALDDLLEAAEDEGVRVLHLAEQLDPLALDVDVHDDDEHDDDEEHTASDGHDHGEFDPHVWLDPVRMSEGARLIARAIADVAASEVDWAARGDAAAAAILDAHADVEASVEGLPVACRVLVTNHEVLGYFAARYDFEVVATLVEGTADLSSMSPQDFARIAEVVREAGVPAIFTEVGESSRLVEALAAEVDGEVAVVALHAEALGEPGSGAETYVGLLRTNARLIADALAPCAA